MHAFADAQVHAFAVDAHQHSWRCLRQAGQFDVVFNGIGVIAVHMLDHPHLDLPGERVCQRDLVQPVDGTKTAYVAMTNRVEHPEIEIMGSVIALRLGKVAVVTLGCGFNGCGIAQLHGFGQHGKTANSLHLFSAPLPHHQGTLGILAQVVGVLGDAADQDQWSPQLIQAIRHHGAEGKSRHGLGLGSQGATVFLEQ